MAIVLLFSLFLLVPYAWGAEDEPKTPLYFSYITTITGSFKASGGIPMVDWALELINNRSDILANYTLQYTTILDSGVGQHYQVV